MYSQHWLTWVYVIRLCLCSSLLPQIHFDGIGSTFLSPPNRPNLVTTSCQKWLKLGGSLEVNLTPRPGLQWGLPAHSSAAAGRRLTRAARQPALLCTHPRISVVHNKCCVRIACASVVHASPMLVLCTHHLCCGQQVLRAYHPCMCFAVQCAMCNKCFVCITLVLHNKCYMCIASTVHNKCCRCIAVCTMCC